MIIKVRKPKNEQESYYCVYKTKPVTSMCRFCNPTGHLYRARICDKCRVMA